MEPEQGLQALREALAKLVKDLSTARADLLEEARRLHLLAGAHKLNLALAPERRGERPEAPRRCEAAHEVLRDLEIGVSCQSERVFLRGETAILADLAAATANWTWKPR